MGSLKDPLINDFALVKVLNEDTQELMMLFERKLHARFNKRPPEILLWGYNVELFNTELAAHKVVIRL
jgi:hypothetical protein